jgi:antitoxin Xre/MbcA/ParS-like protein
MKELLIATRAHHAGAIVDRLIPGKKIEGDWRTLCISFQKLRERTSLPDLTVVDARSGVSPWRKLVAELSAKQGTGKSAFIVFVFASSITSARVRELLRIFPKPERIEITRPADLTKVVRKIEPKIEVLKEIEAAKVLPQGPPPSPLDNIEQVVSATRDLRTHRGNLSAIRIAELYKVSMSKLAKWLGCSRQALNKTPDAENLQNPLRGFEKIARLRLKLSDDDFRKWLRMPNAQLDDLSPLDVIGEGDSPIVVDFVEDMLVGNPT